MNDLMNSFRLDGKVALVTGASYGIGFAIAKARASAGATICFNDLKQEFVDKGLAAYEAEGIKAHAPSGREIYAESDGSVATFPLDEIGTYTVEMRISGADVSYSIYSGAHPDESVPTVREDSFSLSGERTYEKRDGEYDPTVILFICLALLFIADWGLFCYEKYQLR